MDMHLAGRGVVVIGGAQGIGLATAKGFAEEAARVALLDIHPGCAAAAEQLATETGASVVEMCIRDRAYGHLVTLKEPDEYDASLKSWKLETLPFIPGKFLLKQTGDARAKKQFNVIRRLFQNAREIICATDAGREGELIFRYILQHAGCERKEVKRLWLSSLTTSAIRSAFSDLRPASHYNQLYAAARCRSEADWIVGLNATPVSYTHLSQSAVPTFGAPVVANQGIVDQTNYNNKRQALLSQGAAAYAAGIEQLNREHLAAAASQADFEMRDDGIDGSWRPRGAAFVSTIQRTHPGVAMQPSARFALAAMTRCV